MENAAVTQAFPWYVRAVVGRSPRRTLTRVIVLVTLSLILFKGILIPIRVQGISMYPTYENGQINLVNKLAYRRTPPKRGDIVAVRMAGERFMLLKRIVGLPGERIAFRGGKIFVNDAPLDEPYLRLKPSNWNEPEILLGPGEYFYVGDNRTMGSKEHTHARVTLDQIAGKVIF